MGAGRSGTSLTMALLDALGVRTSEDMIGSSDANPKGAYEDTYIFNKQHTIFHELGLNQYFPISSDRISRADLTNHIHEIANYVTQQVNFDDRIWGFKDPKTGNILPFWRRVFGKASVVPKYIVCVRSPADVAASYEARYQESHADFFWLTKYISIFRNIGASGFILHYDDLLSSEANKVIIDLAEFIGIPIPSKAEAKDIISSTIDSKLSRSRWSENQTVNKYSDQLYEAIRQIKGSRYTGDNLRDIVVNIGEEIDKFEGITEAASKIIKKKDQRLKELEKKAQQEYEKKLTHSEKDYKKEISTLVFANEDLSREIVAVQDQLEDYEHKITGLMQQVKSPKNRPSKNRPSKNRPSKNTRNTSQSLSQDQATLLQLRHSYSFRFVSILADAPLSVKGFLRFIPRLLILVFDVISRKGRLKQQLALLSASHDKKIDWGNKLSYFKKSRRYRIARRIASPLRFG